jgi:hypothetical protein
LSCEARQAPMVFVIVAVVMEGGGEYAGRTTVGVAARCWDGAGCEMRGWGESEGGGGGVDPAVPWMGRDCEIRGWGVAARCWDGAGCEMRGSGGRVRAKAWIPRHHG